MIGFIYKKYRGSSGCAVNLSDYGLNLYFFTVSRTAQPYIYVYMFICYLRQEWICGSILLETRVDESGRIPLFFTVTTTGIGTWLEINSSVNLYMVESLSLFVGPYSAPLVECLWDQPSVYGAGWACRA